VDFGELNDKTIKGLMYLSKNMSMCFICIFISNHWSIYLWMNIVWLTLEKTNIWMILMHKRQISSNKGR
jgi:hypothetical protein